MRVRVTPARGLCARVGAPASKSDAHRLLIAAALAQGESVITGVGTSQDIAATIDGLRRLGADIRLEGDTAHVTGCDPKNAPAGEVFCGESGSTLRFLIPLFCLGEQEHFFTGEGRLLQRPQTVYEELFKEQGLVFDRSETAIRAKGPLQAGALRLSGGLSSQFFTGLLFALPLCGQDSTLQILPPFESRSYVVLTLAALAKFGVRAEWKDENTLFIPGGQHYRPARGQVEGDASGAAFFALLGTLCGRITCGNIAPGTLQGDAVFFDWLEKLGAGIRREDEGITVTGAPLTGGTADLADCPDLGPAAMVLGCFCQNGLRLLNTARLRFKESDRAAAMQQELSKLGFLVQVEENEIFMPGARTLRLVHEYTVNAHNDHRIAMALAVAAAALDAPVVIEEAQTVAKSYPAFWDDLARAGVKLEVL